MQRKGAGAMKFYIAIRGASFSCIVSGYDTVTDQRVKLMMSLGWNYKDWAYFKIGGMYHGGEWMQIFWRGRYILRPIGREY